MSAIGRQELGAEEGMHTAVRPYLRPPPLRPPPPLGAGTLGRDGAEGRDTPWDGASADGGRTPLGLEPFFDGAVTPPGLEPLLEGGRTAGPGPLAGAPPGRVAPWPGTDGGRWVTVWPPRPVLGGASTR